MKLEHQTSAAEAAHYILKSCEKYKYSVTPLKLIKLVYIAQGYHLAILDKELFYEDAMAWAYGPIIPEMYYACKQFGKGEVPKELFSGYVEGNLCNIADESRNLIDDVVIAYGKFNGLDLSAATHKRGTPWFSINNSKKDNITIPKSLLSKYYSTLLSPKN